MQLTQTGIPNKIGKKFVVKNDEYEFKSAKAWLHCNWKFCNLFALSSWVI